MTDIGFSMTQEHIKELLANIKELLADNERLRAAVQEVADRYPNMCPEAVRRALKPKP